ncbi:glycosyltransferase [Vibrio chagasii]|uniref:glycosyltransferase n=1 Tax=Vibrio chagasii TaxID=170679 RepID=UPI0035A62096
MKTVLHIITSLGSGGAEGVLYRLCKNSSNFKHIVLNLTSYSFYNEKLESNGVIVHDLEMDKSFLNFYKIYRYIKKYNPDLVQTWMYHSDFLGGIVAKIAGVKKVYWCIRNSDLIFGKSSFNTIFISRVCALLSYIVPTRIISCAHVAKNYHTSIGYNKKNIVVIPNGLDTRKFNTKFEYIYASEEPIKMGMIARFDPQKDHITLFRALQVIKNEGYEFKCTLVGNGINSQNSSLSTLINEFGLADYLELHSEVDNVETLMKELDLHILSSAYGEGFPNVLSEAMACGVPCIATDVGDSRYIINKFGIIVRPNDPSELAEAMVSMIKKYQTNINNDWLKLRSDASKYIMGKYTVERMASNFEASWNGIYEVE